MAMSEAEFAREFERLLDELGLTWHHCCDSRRCNGHKGMPDYIVLGRNGVLFVEIKSETGRTKPEQITWAKRLTYAGAQHVFFRPSDLISGDIRACLVSLHTPRDKAA